MKKRILNILFILFAILSITACGNKEENKTNESENKEMEFKQDLEIIKEENGEIVEGTLEGYTFKVTDKETDRVRIQMNNGDIMLAVLSNSQTPITIENFKNHVQKGTYDGLIFHRVIEDFMIQGGDPTGTGYGDNSIPTIKGEFNSNGVQKPLYYKRCIYTFCYNNLCSYIFCTIFAVE